MSSWSTSALVGLLDGGAPEQRCSGARQLGRSAALALRSSSRSTARLWKLWIGCGFRGFRGLSVCLYPQSALWRRHLFCSVLFYCVLFYSLAKFKVASYLWIFSLIYEFFSLIVRNRSKEDCIVYRYNQWPREKEAFRALCGSLSLCIYLYWSGRSQSIIRDSLFCSGFRLGPCQ